MDKKISQLTAATTPLAGTETLPIVQSGATKKATVQDVLGYVVNDTTNSVLKTVYSSNEVGLKLDFVNNEYYLGDQDGVITNPNYVFVNSQNNQVEIHTRGYLNFLAQDSYTSIGDNDESHNGTILQIDDSDEYVATSYQGNDIGLKLDFANGNFYFGDYVSPNYLFSTNTIITIGDYLGNGNGTYLAIEDGNQRLQLSGNLEANTAGASASKFLKVRIGSVDYKIALLNN